MTLHSTVHTNNTSHKNLLHALMFMLIVNMSLQMFYSNIMAHMPSAYGMGKKTIFNKVQFIQTNGSLMKVKSIAKHSPWSILRYF